MVGWGRSHGHAVRNPLPTGPVTVRLSEAALALAGMPAALWPPTWSTVVAPVGRRFGRLSYSRAGLTAPYGLPDPPHQPMTSTTTSVVTLENTQIRPLVPTSMLAWLATIWPGPKLRFEVPGRGFVQG